MAIHDLKTDPEVFAVSLRGDRPWEIRCNDRDFKICDELHLRETVYTGEEMRNGKPLEYTGRMLTRTVTYMLSGYGIKDGWVMMSVRSI